MPLDQAYSPFHVDRRRGDRLAIALPCRIARGDGVSWLGETTCISADGAAVACAGHVVPGEILTGLIAQIGIVRGRVVRPAQDGFALAFEPQGRPGRVAALIWLEQRLEGARPELRSHTRELPPPSSAVLAIDGAPEEPVVVRDLSFGGARLVTTQRPPVGTPVRLGTLPARVVRHAHDGVAIAFAGP